MAASDPRSVRVTKGKAKSWVGLSCEEPSEDPFDKSVKLRRLVDVLDHDPFGEGDAGVLELPVPGLVGSGAVTVLGPVHLDNGDAAAVGDDESGQKVR